MLEKTVMLFKKHNFRCSSNVSGNLIHFIKKNKNLFQYAVVIKDLTIQFLVFATI